jgi:hypothetical protein
VGGWGFFGLTLLQQFATQHPHGFSDWTQLVGAAVAAVGIHAASSTDGSK